MNLYSIILYLNIMRLHCYCQRFYLTMRAESALGSTVPVTTRHLESLIRLSQARLCVYS